MKTALIILFGAIGAVITLLIILGAMSRSGKPPGLFQGHLSKCADKPNCVCSEYNDDASHYIEPIANTDIAVPAAIAALKTVIADMGGAVQTERVDYLAATFSSSVFGFVDDLEIRVDAHQGMIHMRSASRVGHGDLGVNKVRVEQLKELYKERVANPVFQVPPLTD